jgi:hypothetical protein
MYITFAPYAMKDKKIINDNYVPDGGKTAL